MTTRRTDEPEKHAPHERGARWRALLQIAVGVGALALVILKSDVRAISEAIGSTRIALLPLAVLASFTVTWLMAYRWKLILGAQGSGLKTPRLFLYYLIGIFFMNFVPGGGVSGDVARLIYASREVRDKALVLSSLVYERLVGLFTLLTIGLIATLASRLDWESERGILVAEASLAIAFICTLTLMTGVVSARVARWSRKAGERFNAKRLGDGLARTVESISELRKRRGMLAATVLLSVVIRGVWGVGCFVVARAMGLPLSLPLVFSFMALVDIVRMMPISVGGIGVREWALVALFATVGLSREKAVTFSILAFAPVYLNAIAGGFIYILSARRGREAGSSSLAWANPRAKG